MQLFQNGEPYGEPYTLSMDGGWQHTWLDLPEHGMSYYALETDVPPGYIAEAGNTGNLAVITNTYAGGVAEIVVEKDWSGAEPPDALDVRVTGTNADGEQKYDSGTVTLTAAGGWRAALPIEVGERNLTFDVSETVPDGWRQIGADRTLSEDGATLTFSLTNQKTKSLSAAKAWDDDGNAKGARPASVRLQLLKDGQPYGEPAVADEGSGWACTWTELPDDGSAYAVYEPDGIAGYSSDAPSPESAASFSNGRAVVTNTLVPTTSFTVVKQWANDSGDPLPAGVDVQLYQNGQPYGDPVALSAADSWTATWTDLPAQGMTYTAQETEVPPRYTATSSIEGSTCTIVNTYTGGVAEIDVEKDWSGAEPPDALDVRVTGTNAAGEQKYDSGTVTLTAASGWRAALPVEVGERNLSFDVAEATPDGWAQTGSAASLSEDGTKLVFTLTNQKTTDLTVTKTWDDGDDSLGIRPANVRLQLLKDGQPHGEPIIVNASCGWSHTWTGLADDGSTYTVYEPTDAPGYHSSAPSPDKAVPFSDGGAVIANALEPITSFSVEKRWVDYSGGPLPASVDVQLYQNGLAHGEPVTIDESNGWTHTWDALPASGMSYTAEETTVPDGYEASVSVEGDACTIVNANTSGIERLVVKKSWSGGEPPDRLDVNVVGVDAEGQQRYDAGTVALTAEGGWQAELAVPVGKGSLAFSVTETVPDGFEQTALDSSLSEDGSTLTFELENAPVATPEPPAPEPPATPDAPQEPGSTGTPPSPSEPASGGSPTAATGDPLDAAPAALVALASSAAVALTVAKARRKRRDPRA